MKCHREANREEKGIEKRMKTKGHGLDERETCQMQHRLQEQQKQRKGQRQRIPTMHEKVHLHRPILAGGEAVADDEEMQGRVKAAAACVESSPAAAPLMPLHHAHQSGTEIVGWEDSRHDGCQVGEKMLERSIAGAGGSIREAASAVVGWPDRRSKRIARESGQLRMGSSSYRCCGEENEAAVSGLWVSV